MNKNRKNQKEFRKQNKPLKIIITKKYSNLRKLLNKKQTKSFEQLTKSSKKFNNKLNRTFELSPIRIEAVIKSNKCIERLPQTNK